MTAATLAVVVTAAKAELTTRIPTAAIDAAASTW
jgi:hypothetical protein